MPRVDDLKKVGPFSPQASTVFPKPSPGMIPQEQVIGGLPPETLMELLASMLTLQGPKTGLPPEQGEFDPYAKSRSGGRRTVPEMRGDDLHVLTQKLRGYYGKG